MPESLATERLVLRRLDFTDLVPLHGLFSDSGHSVGKGPVTDVDETQQWLARRQATYEGSGFAWYGIWLRFSILVGTCGVLLSDRCAPEPEIGYEVAAPMRGRGYARESAAAVTSAAHAFGVDSLWASVRTTNTPSLAVLTALGYAHVRTKHHDHGSLAYYCSVESG